MQRTKSTRRRGSALQEAILAATIEELLAAGYDGLTMDGVARRAGTNKNAIYRRWPSRAALVVAAYAHVRNASSHVPDTGSLRGDALSLLRQIGREMSSPIGRVQQSVTAAIAVDPALRKQLNRQLGVQPSGAWRAVLDRAIARGEATRAALHPRIASLPMTLLRHEYITRGLVGPVPDRALREIVELVFLPLVLAARQRRRR